MKVLLKSRKFIAWSIIAKLFLILQMFVTAGLGLATVQGIINVVHVSPPEASVVFVFQGVLALFLTIDLLLTDHSSYERRSWRMEYYTPTTYMLAGGSFMVVALISTTAGWPLEWMINYIIGVVVAGGIAFLLQLKRAWKTISFPKLNTYDT